MGYDAAVIGGGVAGSTVASLLASKGYRALLVDSWIVGGRASSLSLGLVVASSEASRLVERVRGCGSWMSRRLPVYRIAEEGEERIVGVPVAGKPLKGFIVDADAYAQCLVSRAVADHGLRVVEGRRAAVKNGRLLIEGMDAVEAETVVVAAGAWTPQLACSQLPIAKAVAVSLELEEPVEEPVALIAKGAEARMVAMGSTATVAWLEPTNGPVYGAETDPSSAPVPGYVRPKYVRPVAYYYAAVTVPPQPLVAADGRTICLALPGFNGLAKSVEAAEKAVRMVEELHSTL